MKIPEIISTVGVPSSYPLKEIRYGRMVRTPVGEMEKGAARVGHIQRTIEAYSNRIASLSVFESKKTMSKLEGDIARKRSQLQLVQAGVNLVGTVAQQAEFVYDKKMEAQRGIDALKYSGEGERKLKELEIGLRNNPDYKNYAKNFREGAEKIIKDILDKIEDPKVKSPVTEYLMKRAIQYNDDALDFENKAFIADGQSTITESLTDILDDLKESGLTDKQKASKVKEGLGLITWGRDAGFYTEKDKIKAEKAFKKEVEKIRKEQVAGNALLEMVTNPDKVDEILKKPEYKGLTPKEKADLIQGARIESARVEADENRKLKDAKFKEENRFFNSLINNTLTVGDINNSPVLSGDEKNTWLNRLEDRIRGVNVKTNPQTYASLVEEIEQGNTPPREMIAKIVKAQRTGIDEEDGQGLINRITTKERGIQGEWEKKADEHLRKVLMPSSQMIGLKLPVDEATNYAEAYKLLQSEIGKAKKSGKPLSGEEILNKAMEIGNLKQMGLADQIKSLSARTKAEVERLKVSKGQKDKYGFVIGETRVVNGVKGKYIGNNQWQINTSYQSKGGGGF